MDINKELVFTVNNENEPQEVTVAYNAVNIQELSRIEHKIFLGFYNDKDLTTCYSLTIAEARQLAKYLEEIARDVDFPEQLTFDF